VVNPDNNFCNNQPEETNTNAKQEKWRRGDLWGVGEEGIFSLVTSAEGTLRSPMELKGKHVPCRVRTDDLFGVNETIYH
jgi:hypothetical protein